MHPSPGGYEGVKQHRGEDGLRRSGYELREAVPHPAGWGWGRVPRGTCAAPRPPAPRGRRSTTRATEHPGEGGYSSFAGSRADRPEVRVSRHVARGSWPEFRGEFRRNFDTQCVLQILHSQVSARQERKKIEGACILQAPEYHAAPCEIESRLRCCERWRPSGPRPVRGHSAESSHGGSAVPAPANGPPRKRLTRGDPDRYRDRRRPARAQGSRSRR